MTFFILVRNYCFLQKCYQLHLDKVNISQTYLAKSYHLIRGVYNTCTKNHISEMSKVYAVDDMQVSKQQKQKRSFGNFTPYNFWVIIPLITDRTTADWSAVAYYITALPRGKAVIGIRLNNNLLYININ